MEEKEKLTKFEISKCFEKGADYFVLISNDEKSLVDVSVKVHHSVTWDNVKEGEISFYIYAYEEAKTIRCDFCYDLPSFYKQLALGIDLIASYYKNDKNTVTFQTSNQELAEQVHKLPLWSLTIDSGMYIVKRGLERPSEKKNSSYDTYANAVFWTGC